MIYKNMPVLKNILAPIGSLHSSSLITRRVFSKFSDARLASSVHVEPFLNGESSIYIEQMYEHWLKDPTSVHASWNAYFTNVKNGYGPGKAFTPPSTLIHPSAPIFEKPSTQETPPVPEFQNPDALNYLPGGASFITLDTLPTNRSQSVHDTSRIIQMIRGYQMRGHQVANIEPLGLPPGPPFTSVARSAPPTNIDYKYYGFTESDLNKVFDCRVPGLSGFLSPDRDPLPLRQIITRLQESYCGSIGVEYMHISDQAVCNFLRQMIETPQKYSFSPEMKQKILVRTARSQLFENFCTTKFSTAKRFGLDGCETLIVGLKAITKKATREGVNSILFGMAHRGRLNVLVNVMHKPLHKTMSELQGKFAFGGMEWGNTGDAKYHLGVEFDHWDADNQSFIHMGVLANPSHLEAVNPLVQGQIRAQQYYSGDTDKSKAMPIIIHGDASIAGQGVVYETLQMSQLPNYTVGGTIHIVVNNNIGFTTCPVDASSGKYCTDIAKAIDAPVFHVNADDPEAVTFVSELALEYRQRFKADVIIDLVGYRRYGHNELDMPKFTQPLMYTLISRHKPVLDIYANKLLEEGVIDEAKLNEIKQTITDFYEAEYAKSKTSSPVKAFEYLPQWQHMVQPQIPVPPRMTGFDLEHFRELGRQLYTLPISVNPHPTVGKIFKARLEAINTGENIDFGTAETMAYATLLSDGFHIRLAGQDSERGTFSHRHATIHDQTLFNEIKIFDSLKTPQKIEICNSPLSEYASLGFEVGYSMEHPDSLSIWEAQYGDFANGAQIITDQFIASGEAKWNRQCGIVIMLPHGYDGNGPEHSSCRVERFLQLCDDREDVIQHVDWDKSSVIQQHNIQVIMPTTPANMFHALRRQMHRGFRKPLVICSPKNILKMRVSFCNIDEFGEGTSFKRYIPDVQLDPQKKDQVKRLILCSGQVYYSLSDQREKLGLTNIAIARVEQISPFPFEPLFDDVKEYPNLQDIVWAQEEPMNMGSWSYTSKRIESALNYLGNPNGIKSPIYCGRDVSASVAVGDPKIHQEELSQILQDSFNLNRGMNSYQERYLQKLSH